MTEQRRLDGADKEKVAQLLSVGGNKKLVQAHTEEATGNKVLLRDLHNIALAANVSHTHGLDSNTSLCLSLIHI